MNSFCHDHLKGACSDIAGVEVEELDSNNDVPDYLAGNFEQTEDY
jgi:hypothetical protein